MSDEHLTFEGDKISGDIAFLVKSIKQRRDYPGAVEWDVASDFNRLLRSGLVHKLAERVTREIAAHEDGIVRVRIVAIVEHQP